jgi:ceramide glucosyltransferase
MLSIRSLVTIAAFAGLGLAAAYSLLTVIAACIWRMQGTSKNSRTLPPVTLLKPLCGAEPGLYEHLRSYCRHNYPL